MKTLVFVLALLISETVKAQCLKITEKVSLNIASEASYVYILSGQKCGQTVLPDRSIFIGQKLVKNLNATSWMIFKQCAFAFTVKLD